MVNIMKTDVRTESFRVKSSDLENFKSLLYSVLPNDAEVNCFTTSVSDVQVTVPSKVRRVFREIRKCGLLL